MRTLMNRFGLAHVPFSKEVAAEDLFELESQSDAIARLKAAVESKASAVLVGDPGVGKTCVLRGLERALNPARSRVTYLHHANVSPRDFYRQLSMVLGLEPKAHPSALFRQIQAHIEDLADEQKIHPVLLLDESQLLPIGMLEQLHILLNYRMDSRAFLSVILVGLPELRERLGRNLLGSLSTRLPVRIHLEPLRPRSSARMRCCRSAKRQAACYARSTSWRSTAWRSCAKAREAWSTAASCKTLFACARRRCDERGTASRAARRGGRSRDRSRLARRGAVARSGRRFSRRTPEEL
jgi:type II secretory pathway predicted ATPase ExeA